VAYEQFDLNKALVPVTPVMAKGLLKVVKTENAYILSGKNFSVEFDVKAGLLKNYTYNKAQLLQHGPEPAFWRAPTDNDIGAGFNRSLRKWRNAYAEGKLIASAINNNADGSYTVNFKKELLNAEATVEQLITVFADGTLKVDNRLTAVKGKYPLLLRVGTNLELNDQYQNIQFYGRGPWENYWDRKTASLVGVYNQKVKDQYFNYARPQESGNKTEVRWVNFTNKKGEGLQFVYEKDLLSFAALPYSLDDLDPEQDKKQYHSGELTLRNKVYLHMDLQQTGLQGIDSWGAMPLKKYRIPYTNQQYSYWIKPIK
jgi:beta-galactosidase